MRNSYINTRFTGGCQQFLQSFLHLFQIFSFNIFSTQNARFSPLFPLFRAYKNRPAGGCPQSGPCFISRRRSFAYCTAAASSAATSASRSASRFFRSSTHLRQTGTGGDQLTDDDVLLQTGQRIDLALMAASVSTRVVSWKEAADRKDSFARAALVMPSNTC